MKLNEARTTALKMMLRKNPDAWAFAEDVADLALLRRMARDGLCEYASPAHVGRRAKVRITDLGRLALAEIEPSSVVHDAIIRAVDRMPIGPGKTSKGRS